MTQAKKDEFKKSLTYHIADLYQIIAYLLRENILEEYFYHYHLLFPLKREQDEQRQKIYKKLRQLKLNKRRSRSISSPSKSLEPGDRFKFTRSKSPNAFENISLISHE